MREVFIPDVGSLSTHPAADLFPMLDEGELRELADDIKANGLISPIVVRDGQVLDGRNRLRACDLAGVQPNFVEWAGTGSINAWVFSVNLRRRHLTTAQRAMLAARSIELFQAEAEGRMRLGLPAPADDRGKAADKAADAFDVGARTIFRAQTVLERAAPELVDAVETGEVPVAAAAEVATLPPEEQRTVVREKKVAARAKELRDARKPKAPRPPGGVPTSLPSPVNASPTKGSPIQPSDAAVDDREDEDADASADAWGPPANDATGEDEDDEPMRPIPPPLKPLGQTQFRNAYVRGKKPSDELPYLEQIRDTLRSALLGWRATVIQWQAPPHRTDMEFACDKAGAIAMYMQKSLTEIEEIVEVCRAAGLRS